MPGTLNVHFEFDTKAELWLPPGYYSGGTLPSKEFVIPAKSIILADSGGFSFAATLILDIRVPMKRGFERVSIYIPFPNLGNINFLPKEETELRYKRFDLNSLVSSRMNN